MELLARGAQWKGHGHSSLLSIWLDLKRLVEAYLNINHAIDLQIDLSL